jgi:transcriptional regulator NrdR family protein|tara:strand:- start:418 stop:729 length:312 start_codon:yes stop_codon:yes gene_type:complete
MTNCPKCNGITKTVSTKAIGDKYGKLMNEGEVVRRKRCTRCNYRFYTHGLKNRGRHNLNPETILESHQVVYVGSCQRKDQKIQILSKNNQLKRISNNKVNTLY